MPFANMKKSLKVAAAVLLAPVVLLLVLAAAIYLPPVQNWAVRHVASYVSEQTGMEVTVGRVRLAFPLDLGVDGILVTRRNDTVPERTDTVADVRSVVADVRLLPLLRSRVEIDALELSAVRMNTGSLVPEARVRGKLGRLYMESHGIDLGAEVFRLDEAVIAGADVSIELSDTVPPDTAKSDNRWKIYAARLNVADTRVVLHTPGDTLCVSALVGGADVEDGFFDLHEGLYRIRRMELSGGALGYDNNFAPRAEGFDYNHIALEDVNIGIDSLYYRAPELRLSLRTCSFGEKSGLAVSRLEGALSMDSAGVSLPALVLRTPDSSLDARIAMDWNAFDKADPGKLQLSANGSFGKRDIMLFLGGMPSGFVRRWPNQPLTLKAVLSGNMRHVRLAGLNVKLPTAFNINAEGFAANVDDAGRLRADVTLRADAYDIGFLTALLPEGALGGARIPNGIGLDGRLRADGRRYRASLHATEGGGALDADVDFNSLSMKYAARIEARGLHADHFLPGYGMGPFTGRIEADGSGTDLMAGRMRLKAGAEVKAFSFGGYGLDNIRAAAEVDGGSIRASVHSDNSLLRGMANLSAFVSGSDIKGTLEADIDRMDFYSLRLAEVPLALGLCGHLDLATNMKDLYKVQGSIGDITLRTAKGNFRPHDIELDVFTSADTTYAFVNSGDLVLRAKADRGYEALMAVGDRIMAQIYKDREARKIDYPALRSLLPGADVYFSAGTDNVFSRYMAYKGFAFSKAGVDVAMSPEFGIDGDVNVFALTVDSTRIDTISLSLKPDGSSLGYRLHVRNSDSNPKYTFNAFLGGTLLDHGLSAGLRFYDASGLLGLRLGLEAAMEHNGIRLRMQEGNAVLGYKEFGVNDDNYIFMGDDGRVSAKMFIRADDGQGVQLYSNDDNIDALQDLTLSLNRFDLEKILSVVPYAPHVTGVLNGDVNFVQTAENLSVASSVSVREMFYENNRVGNIATEFVYLPMSDGTHAIDGILLDDGREVASLTGSYNPKGEGTIDASLVADGMPLSVINGFVPDGIVGFKGTCEGELSIRGTLKRPDVNGELFLDSCYMVSVPYGAQLRFSDDPVRIVGSNLLFENFEMFAYNENPINVYGNIDFADLDRVKMNVRIRANDCQIINAKENLRSVAFGKVFVNFFGSMSGAMDNLTMRGRLDVLGSTDMSYILRDSPLTTDNQLDELVRFTDFKDTVSTVVSRPPINGFNMNLSVNVDRAARIMCYLNADHSNYVDLMGDGSLRMTYNPADNLMLTGRYTLNNGEMKYSLPVIPLKTFTIQDGSYIEFMGDIMNPRLNITATEHVKANVSSDGGQGRLVDFNCGVVITRTLSDMGLEFVLEAPEDMAMGNELRAMSVEQRGKLAVTMLTTGMYLADGNTSGFSMNSALSSFLQSEINHITGNALRTLDLSFGMDNATDASGNIHTDYSFKFAKRFWNNRIKIVVGGKLSTGPDVANQNESFFDNVSLEYRLSDTANQYLRLFYDNNAYDWLEGYTQEYGVGFVWKRTLQHFSDIFRLKEPDVRRVMPRPAQRDSLKAATDSTTAIKRQ